MRKWDKIAADKEAAAEIRDPGCTARKKAALRRERLIREARETTEEQYRDLLTKLATGKRPHPVKLSQVMTALGKTEEDVAADAELRVAEIEDEKEIARCNAEKAALQKQIDEAKAEIAEAEVSQTRSARQYDELQEKISAIHATVAHEEKRDLAKALSRNNAATGAIQQANTTIRELQNKIADMRPKTVHVARLRARNDRLRREAQDRRDLAEARPYLDPDLPRGELASILSPKAGDDDNDRNPNERKVPLGSVNGETTFAIVSLG